MVPSKGPLVRELLARGAPAPAPAPKRHPRWNGAPISPDHRAVPPYVETPEAWRPLRLPTRPPYPCTLTVEASTHPR
eukprot:scaffold2788_cov376-Prasinococcus_capsulatus_cf.AAC.6